MLIAPWSPVYVAVSTRPFEPRVKAKPLQRRRLIISLTPSLVQHKNRVFQRKNEVMLN